MPAHAAGFVLFAGSGAARRYCLLQSAAHGDWGFPKGHQAAGEGEMGAALRETLEETGIQDLTPLPGFRRTVTYVTPAGVSKTVAYFVARAGTTALHLSPEHAAGNWYDAGACHERLRHGALGTLLDDVAAWLDAPPAAPAMRRQVMTCVLCDGRGGTPELEVRADYGRLYALCGADPAAAPALVDTYVRCPQCDLTHLTHRLEEDLWHAFTFATADPAKHAADVPALAATAAHDAALVQARAAGPRWLEIGSGYGYTLAAGRALGAHVQGIDLAPAKLAYARDRLGVPAAALHLGDPMGLELTPGGFDAVLLVHVLEHLANPVGVLRRIAGWLAPGGLVLLATPNLQSWKARRDGPHWGYATPFGHLALYERATLDRALADAGLRVRERVHRVAVEGAVGRAAKRALAACFPDALSELCVVAERAG